MPSWGNACETIPFLHRHFERKREIFFRSRSSRRCEDSGIFVSQPSPQGEGAPKGRIGQKRYERERGRSSQVRSLRKYPIHRWRGPPSPMGKAKRRRLRRQKESQPRLAALGSPFQGKGLAWTRPPSSGRRENSAFPVSSSRAQSRDLSCTAVCIPHVVSRKRRTGIAFFRFQAHIVERSARKISRLCLK